MDHPVVRDFLTRLSRRSTLVRYDMRGSGLSDRDVDDFSLDALSLDLEAVVAQLGEVRLRLLSLGALAGPLALRFAAAQPGRVERIALYGGFVRGTDLMSDGDHRQLVEYTRRFGFPNFSFTDGRSSRTSGTSSRSSAPATGRRPQCWRRGTACSGRRTVRTKAVRSKDGGRPCRR